MRLDVRIAGADSLRDRCLLKRIKLSATVHVGAIPQALVVEPVRNKILWRTNFGHSVTVIDGATNATFSTVQVGKAPGDCAERGTNKSIRSITRRRRCPCH